MIALFGIAVLNGIVMLAASRALRLEQGVPRDRALGCRRENHGQTERTMVKTGRKPWPNAGSGPFRAELGLSPVFGGIRFLPVEIGGSRPEFGNSDRFASDFGSRIGIGKQENRPATAPVRSAWIDPEPWSIRPEAPVDSARAMVVSGWSHGQPRVA